MLHIQLYDEHNCTNDSEKLKLILIRGERSYDHDLAR